LLGARIALWPRSRTRTPKQLLNIVGKDTMLQTDNCASEAADPAERNMDGYERGTGRRVRKQVPARSAQARAD